MTTTTAPAGRVNDRLEPCGTESARRRHLARMEHCDTCRVEGPVRR
jgi:hypothetical protein